MSRKPITIIIASLLLLIGAVAFGFWKTGTENQSAEAAISKVGLTLDLNFGNNNAAAAPTVYDSSGFARHATSTSGATSPTCGGKFCDFDGGDCMTANATNVFNSSNFSFAVKFTPDFTPVDGYYSYIFDSTESARNLLAIVNGSLYIAVGGSEFSVTLANYEQYWKTNKENIVIYSGVTGNNKLWLNGYNVLTNSSVRLTNSPTGIIIGARYSKSLNFDGKIHYLKIWNRLLTDAEVAILSADRETFTNSAPIVASSTLDRRLVGHWTMDANDISGVNYYDKSGFKNTATSTASPTITAGKMNQAVGLDGSTQFIDTNISNLSVSSLTVSFWAKKSSASALNQILIGKAANYSAGTLGWIIYYYPSGSDSVLYCQAGDGSNYKNVSYTLPSNILTNWNHVVMTVATGASGKTSCYVNGVNVADSASGGLTSGLNSATNLWIGRNQGSGGKFAGSIDDVRIYNYAMSAQEVANLYSSAKTNYIASAPLIGLVGHWTMDAGDISGVNYFDKSGFKNTATSTGSPTIAVGKINQALGLNSTTQFLNAGGGASLNLVDNFSISAWVKTNSIGAIQMIVNKSGGAFTDSQYELRLASTGVPNFTATNGTSAFTASHNILKTNQWYHLVGVMDNKVMNIYVDGVVGTAATLTGTQSTNSLNTFIGRGGGLYASNYFFNGSIDDVRIYNRALSAAEVANLYQSAKRSYQ